MSREIEPGCLAILIKTLHHPEQVGKTTRVGEAIHHFSEPCEFCGVVGPDYHVPDIEPSPGYTGVISCPCALLRIDGHTEDEREEEVVVG